VIQELTEFSGVSSSSGWGGNSSHKPKVEQRLSNSLISQACFRWFNKKPANAGFLRVR